jgi:hypothetical protein
MNTEDDEKASREPFVGREDRPEVRLDPDKPLSELRVRDLAAIFRLGGTRKDFWDGKSWQKDDFDGGGIKWWKEGKEGKDWKDKDKEKPEKLEKREVKELKLEKLESDGTFDPGTAPIPDPRIDQVIHAVSGLSARIGELADQIEALKKRGKG